MQNLKEDQLSLLAERDTLGAETQKLAHELHRTKDALNSYDWKLFCLETELDLCSKDRKQLALTNDSLELTLREMENKLNSQRIALFTHEEEHKLLTQQNRYLNGESQRKQNIIEDLLVQIDSLRQSQESHKELEYRLREKDEELSVTTQYLKQKIGELDVTKKLVSCSESQRT